MCATPIGNLGDVTPRLRETLAAVELIAAEDTRRTRTLLSHLDIHTPTTSLFRHNEVRKSDEMMARLSAGADIALVSDAGMPAVSDPGQRLVAAALAAGVPVTVIPGPSAPATALVASGFAGDGFRFVGYLPRRAGELAAAVAEWQHGGGLVVAFETAPRLGRSLERLATAVPLAAAAVCRELTKVHEEVVRGSVAELSERYAGEPPRGEITLVLDLGPAAAETHGEAELERLARALLERGLSRRDAAAALQICLALPRREAEALTQRLGERS